jgi:uncharacterized protein involved in outer membrane biogenesis
MKKSFPLTRFLLLLLGLVLASGTAAFLYVARADLQPYFQEELTKALGRPVTMKEVRLRFFPAPALDFRDIVSEVPGDPVASVRVPHLRLQPSFLALLRGRLVFNRITLQSPALRIDLAHLKGAEKPAPPAGQENPSGSVRLEILRLRRGSLTLVDGSRFPTPLLLSNVNSRLVMKPGHPRSLTIEGEISLDESAAPFTGEFSWGDSDVWRQEALSARFLVSRLPLSALVERIPRQGNIRAAGNCDLSLRASGRPSDGVTIDLKLNGEKLSLTTPLFGGQTLPVKDAALHALWRSDSQHERFSDLALNLGGPLLLTGTADLEKRQEGPWLKAQFASSPLGSADLPSAAAKELPVRGTLEVKSCIFDGPAAALWNLPLDLSPLRAQVHLSDIEARLPLVGVLEKGEADLRLEGELLRLDNGRFVLGGAGGEVSAVLDAPLRQGQPSQLEATGSFPLAPLISTIPSAQTKGWNLQGAVLPFKITGDGTGDSFRIHLDSDLAGLVKPFIERKILAVKTPAALALSLDLDRENWRLTEGTLTCGPLLLRASGDGKIQNPQEFRLTLRGTDLPLGKLAATLPRLQRWDLSGKASLTASVSGTQEGGPRFDGGELRLVNAGLHTTGMLADLSGVNGRFLITPQGISAEKVTGLLGASPLQIVTVSLENFSDPVVKLHVQGKKVLAKELIFPSDEAYLYDLDGHLRIDRNELLFQKVDVTLAQGTRARVRGYVRNFNAPETWLHITSEKADIDEVIALWKRSGPRPEEEPSNREPRLLIDMEVAQGSIDGFEFSNATGQLRLKDGRILIHPLEFQAGPGSGQGQVIVDPRPAGPAQLRISGHVDNLDAETVSRQVLSAKSIATGSLSGDFYLECRAEKGFLASSQGKFSGEIRQGVLREFKILAKVFSLLNVSQLFSMKLPDMSTEGMPFDRITATADLNQGILASENLLVDSTSMKLSLVGTLDLINDQIDAVMGVRPLGTVDRVMSRIPIAGWILGGKEKALITAQFRLSGTRTDPVVDAIPVTSLSDKVVGIFRRILQLPGTVISNPRELIGGGSGKTGQ